METEDIKRAITDQEEEINEKFSKEKISSRELNPDKYLQFPNVLAILGVRRCGKSIFSLSLAKRQNIAYGYVNFDDPILGELKSVELNKVLEALYQLKGKLDFIILDEIHNINKWELFVTRLRETKRVIVTGSNSEMLSGELATRLTGRRIDFTLFPFSFREYLMYKEFSPNMHSTKDIAKTKLLLRRYIEDGGFPEVQKYGGRIVSQIYQDIIQKDIINRYKIKFVSTLKEMAKLMIANFSNEITYNKLKNILRIKSLHTIKNYADYMEKAFLLFKIERYSPKLKEQIIAPKKIYIMDHSISRMAFGVSENKGKIYENIVAVELQRKKFYFNPYLDIFYWKDYQQNEIDFVLKKGKKIEKLIQVCYEVDDITTKQREIRALLKASRELKCKHLFVITRDYESEEKAEWYGINRKIKFIPLWKWLLEVDLTSPRVL